MLSDRDNDILKCPLTWIEVKNPFFSMQPMKAPGPDGFQPEFLQTYLGKIGSSIFDQFKLCFTNWNFPKEINKCFITLIPKIENPESISNFRSITLCNVSYKILSKVLVNRIRPMLDKIVGPCQSSFIPV